MTLEEQTQIALKCETIEEFEEKYQYRLGREAAISNIAEGNAGIFDDYDLTQLFCAAWVRGYREYMAAWKVLNAA